MDLFHIGGDLRRVHGVALLVAESVAVAFADGFHLICQIHLDYRLPDFVGDGGGADDVHRGIVQLDVFRVVQIILRPGAVILHHHRHILHPAVFHIYIKVALGQRLEGILRHVSGVGNGVAQIDLLPRLGDRGQVGLDRNIVLVDLDQIASGACQLQRHRGGGRGGTHQPPLVQDALALQHHRDVVVSLLGIGADVSDDVQPEAKGDDDGQQNGAKSIFHCRPSPFCGAAASASAADSSPASRPRRWQGTVHCAAACPASGAQGAA